MKKNTFLAFMLFTTFIFAQDGNLDTNFGTNGYVEFSSTNIGVYNDCLQPDGKIIYRHDNTIQRLNQNGSSDTSFGNSGTISMVEPGNYRYGILHSNTDNKIVTLSKNLYTTYYMSKYNLDGTHDATFGNSGQGYINLDVDDIESPLIVKLSPNGTIFVGGNDDRSGTGVDDLFLRKYDFDGAADESFHYTSSNIGINLGSTSVGHSSDDRAVDVDIMSETKIVLTGRGTYYNVNSVSHYRSSIVIIENGVTNPVKRSAPYSNPSNVVKSNTTIDSANNIYMLTGINNTFTVNPQNVIHKWNSSGSLIDFGTDDRLTITLEVNPNEFANFQRILVQPDGKMLLAGTTFNASLSGFKKPNLIIARYLADGTLDTTFGTNGYVLHAISYSGASTDNTSHSLTHLFASDDFSSIYISGRNAENYVILKYGVPSLLSVDDVQVATNSVQMFPNPAKDMVTIRTADASRLHQKQYAITDITGQVIKQGTFYSDNEVSNINISQLRTGIYFLKIKGFTEVLKLIKK
ncbi:T9SS type A sorting domain-containing protein [Kordia sp.]|uniref:T9SS type A sorting domain-containing protein n=1 Tax=Kordia sp. TaxID=1965332 RepID=UPI003B5936EC